ncbi:ATP-binding cassette domain-containing protein [bacterium D16-51]|nr:ATP-binding cassette domain-containing protein [bacterium D16-59]RKI54437.1 ATP-binding cassette domain-containing protein [bacterium D16-51]
MIVLQNIGKYYYSDTSVTQALRKITLEFQTGEFVAITGESGSGKSTLLNIISGMDTFDEGEMYFEGEPTFQYDDDDWERFRRERIGFVFQDYSLIGHYSALENITGVLLLLGLEDKEAEQKAYHYLERVGLKGLEKQRASELSSGQKQRLSIARALAKETSIIVADEPTGNLDSETGEQIVSLLKELSNDRLIIMVTHNYEQAEPYVTRKIRLHDGEVVADVHVNDTLADETAIKNDKTNAPQPIKENSLQQERQREKFNLKKHWPTKQQRKIVKIFARLNRTTQPGRAFLFRILFLITAVTSFIFIGQLFKNADDTSTKDYEKEIFYQKNDSRLSVRRMDNKALTQDDIKKMQSVRHVTSVDQYDYVNDINYYCEEGKDYHYTYGLQNDDTYGSYMMKNGEFIYEEGVKNDDSSDKTVVFDKKNKFMKSSTCINQNSLEKGRLPEKRLEIVLYSDDKSILGKEKEIYFTAENITGGDTYYYNKFTVVGLLKEKTSQIYFHGDFCHMISAPADGDQLTMKYFFDKDLNQYLARDQFYLAINDDLTEENKAVASKNYIVPAISYDYAGLTVEQTVPGSNIIYIKLNKEKEEIPKKLSSLDGIKQDIFVDSEQFNEQGGLYLEVSETTFQKYFPRKSTQASVYIKNYTKTDRVIRKLEKLGYQAVSTYRISSIEYNPDKVMERLTFILISSGILAVLAIAGILILRAFLKLKIKDFIILKSMGMKLEMLYQISLYELLRYCLEAILVTVIIMLVLNAANIPFISSMIIYYGIFASAAFILYNILLEYIAVKAFNRALKGRIGL